MSHIEVSIYARVAWEKTPDYTLMHVAINGCHRIEIGMIGGFHMFRESIAKALIEAQLAQITSVTLDCLVSLSGIERRQLGTNPTTNMLF